MWRAVVTWELLAKLLFVLLVVLPAGAFCAATVTYVCTDMVPDFRRWMDRRQERLANPLREEPQWTWIETRVGQ